MKLNKAILGHTGAKFNPDREWGGYVHLASLSGEESSLVEQIEIGKLAASGFIPDSYMKDVKIHTADEVFRVEKRKGIMSWHYIPKYKKLRDSV